MLTYEVTGNINAADCVIGHSFGTSTGPDSVNEQLGTQLVAYASGRPMIADRTLVDAIPDYAEQIAHVVDGSVTNIKAQGVGT